MLYNDQSMVLATLFKYVFSNITTLFLQYAHSKSLVRPYEMQQSKHGCGYFIQVSKHVFVNNYSNEHTYQTFRLGK